MGAAAGYAGKSKVCTHQEVATSPTEEHYKPISPPPPKEPCNRSYIFQKGTGRHDHDVTWHVDMPQSRPVPPLQAWTEGKEGCVCRYQGGEGGVWEGYVLTDVDPSIQEPGFTSSDCRPSHNPS